MIDIHSHVLPGIDDGSKNITMSLEILKGLEEQGVTDLICTPHYIAETSQVSPRAKNEELLKKLQERAKKKGIKTNLYLGNEIYIDRDIAKLIRAKKISPLAKSKYLLVELPMSGEFEQYEDILLSLQQKKWHIRNQHLIDKEYTEKVELLNTAISEKRMVILHNYSSVKSNTISDRIVEPYVFMGNNDSVRCYEHSTQTDKTFRLSRIGSVELMPINWIHEDRHGQVFTDAFNFSGERQFPVEICLNFRAVRLLVEEYPGCTPYVMRKSGTEWRLKMNVCDFRGIGRFCLGLFKDVKPIGSQAFLDYLNDNIAELQNLHYTIPERHN